MPVLQRSSSLQPTAENSIKNNRISLSIIRFFESIGKSINPKSSISEKIFSNALTLNQENLSWKGALQTFSKSFYYNFLFICRISLPLMLLTAVLGAFIIELFPFSSLTNFDTSSIFLTLLPLGFLAVLLPVPIAFDVIIVSSLFQRGVDLQICMIFLFCLGLYSIYPYLIISKEFSNRLANLILAVLIGLGLLASLTAQKIQNIYESGFQNYYGLSQNGNGLSQPYLAQFIESECHKTSKPKSNSKESEDAQQEALYCINRVLSNFLKWSVLFLFLALSFVSTS